MHNIMVRTDQLLCIAEATNSNVYTQELEAVAHAQMKAMVLSLKHIPYPLLLAIWKGYD